MIETTVTNDSRSKKLLLEGPSGEVQVYKTVGCRCVPKLKTFVKKEASGNNEGFKKEWFAANKQEQTDIFEDMLQYHMIKKNSELKVVAAVSTLASETVPIVNHNYYASCVDTFPTPGRSNC